MRITDPKALRAMAHPLRIDLLDLLGRIGPATAATCARHLDTSQASCSFHLRQLAKYGYVEEAEPSQDKRERLWQVTDHEQQWSSADGDPAALELEKVFVEREASRMAAWSDIRTTTPEEWQRAAFLGGVTAPMTPQELELVGKQFSELLAPYIARIKDHSLIPDDAKAVRIFMHGAPNEPLAP